MAWPSRGMIAVKSFISSDSPTCKSEVVELREGWALLQSHRTLAEGDASGAINQCGWRRG